MSKVGKKIITIPAGTTVGVAHGYAKVTGPKGELMQRIEPGIDVVVEEGTLTVKRNGEDKDSRAKHGLVQSLLASAVTGVTNGFTKTLEMTGVGYRAQANGSEITLTVGYSHPVKIKAPAGITFAVGENNKITVTGIDKQLVGLMAHQIREVRKPEPYKGKGIRYQGEHIRRKAGKAAKTAK